MSASLIMEPLLMSLGCSQILFDSCHEKLLYMSQPKKSQYKLELDNKKLGKVPCPPYALRTPVPWGTEAVSSLLAPGPRAEGSESQHAADLHNHIHFYNTEYYCSTEFWLKTN